jgi:tRNA dimethylallyltransferase
MADPVLVITGPTASGKSALALAVAERLNGEIISMDSRQVYRGLDIGTAKPTAGERARVPHHGLDLIDPDQRYSAGQFARDAREWIAAIRARGRTPVIAGGTLFFLRALEQPLFDEPPLDPVQREALRTHLNGLPLETLQRWAARVAAEPDGPLPSDRQRLARLIEVATLTGRPLSEWHACSPVRPGVRTVTFVMTLERAELYRRINLRVHEMLAHGLIAEVQGLVARGYGREHPGMNATGYLELLPHVIDGQPPDEAVTLIQAASRRYARRQLTWLRTQLGPDVHELDATLPVARLVEQVESVWRREAS